ncbi:hypothetical protein MNV49_001052 [Pseudohyphozyma bogoriensis]|nr:hypothetical protein MNV49_001052 [Pseudohyphozyma bogoriensis]
MASETQKTVYVGGFSNDTNANHLHSAFTPFGEILDIQLPPDPSHQAPHRGFAFLTFSNATSAWDAIDNMNRNVLPGPANAGRPLKCNIAKPPKGLKTGGSNRATGVNGFLVLSGMDVGADLRDGMRADELRSETGAGEKDAQIHEEVYSTTEITDKHKAEWSHELIGGAAAFAAAKAYEKHQAEKGKPVNHALAKELIAGFAGAEVDKLFETKGLDFIDREKAKHHAKKEAEAIVKEDNF